MTTEEHNPYKDAGVDVAKGDRLVGWLKEGSTPSNDINKGFSDFAGCFRADFKAYDDPLLVSGTDGVGTKVLLAIENNILSGLGYDLVAMCANDLYTIGAKPLFFLDYYATGMLDDNQFKTVLKSIKDALNSCNATLLGGETAEMPGLYAKGHFDLAGFIVGIVDAEKRLGPKHVKSGDRLYAWQRQRPP